MTSLSHTDDDGRIVEGQLGRPLRGEWQVARRCHLGVPMVIENHPRLEDGSPFPTLFWLTCPILVKRVGKIEGGGGMVEMNDRLARDSSFRARLRDAVTRYARRRDALERLEGASVPGGGAERVKCLHAHVAHELADPPNAAGARALAETGWPDCVAPCAHAPQRAASAGRKSRRVTP